jgi:hypothetical protein
MSPEVTVLDVSDHRPRRVPSKTWRELIKKIWEVDPLSSPRCGHEMKIISLIHKLDVIERIFRHLVLECVNSPHIASTSIVIPAEAGIQASGDYGPRLLPG